MEKKTRKVLDINVEGIWWICVFDLRAKTNPYKLYRKWYENGWHRKKVEEYGNFVSVLCHLRDYAFTENWGFKDFFG